MTYDLETRRAVSLRCQENHRLAIFVPVLHLFLLSFYFLLFYFFFKFWSYPLRPDFSYPGGFSKLRSSDGGS